MPRAYGDNAIMEIETEEAVVKAKTERPRYGAVVEGKKHAERIPFQSEFAEAKDRIRLVKRVPCEAEGEIQYFERFRVRIGIIRVGRIERLAPKRPRSGAT